MELMVNSWDSAKRLSTNGAQEFVFYISSSSYVTFICVCVSPLPARMQHCCFNSTTVISGRAYSLFVSIICFIFV